MSHRLLTPLAEARRYSKFANRSSWRSWRTEGRWWASCATRTQGTIAYFRRKNGTLPPTWVYVAKMRRHMSTDRGSSSLPAVLPPLVTALLLVLSVAYREPVRTLVWLTPLALLVLAVAVGCVWLAGRLTARPPMTEHLRPSDDEQRLLERLR